MKEVVGNIFDQTDADAICFTANGTVRKNGNLVMGGGIAQQFLFQFPGIDKTFGDMVKYDGNHVYGIMGPLPKKWIISFPTKNHWIIKSDISLIRQSCVELVEFINKEPWVKKVYLPRPGCGLGGLKWEIVKKVIEPLLDDRFYIITNEV